MDSRSDHSSIEPYEQYIIDVENDDPDAYDKYMVAMGYQFDDEEGEYV
jgi:hypothetical protein